MHISKIINIIKKDFFIKITLNKPVCSVAAYSGLVPKIKGSFKGFLMIFLERYFSR